MKLASYESAYLNKTKAIEVNNSLLNSWVNKYINNA